MEYGCCFQFDFVCGLLMFLCYVFDVCQCNVELLFCIEVGRWVCWVVVGNLGKYLCVLCFQGQVDIGIGDVCIYGGGVVQWVFQCGGVYMEWVVWCCV